MRRRPVIGVTGPVRGGLFAWIMTWFALKRAGARPVRLTAETITDNICLDGLVLGGGSDIDPENYGEELLRITDPEPEQRAKDRVLSLVLFLLRVVFSVKTAQPAKDTDRDDMEKKLCRHALDNRLPVLGICRGAQLINIALGGALYQNTRGFYTETPHIKTILPRKWIYLEETSRIRKILGVDTCMVNSLHNQAISTSGADIIITGTDKNKIVQAIEHSHHPFMIGVQWHPEYLPQVRIQQNLFQTLVDMSRR